MRGCWVLFGCSCVRFALMFCLVGWRTLLLLVVLGWVFWGGLEGVAVAAVLLIADYGLGWVVIIVVFTLFACCYSVCCCLVG